MIDTFFFIDFDRCKQRAGLWKQELERFLAGRQSRYRLVEQRALVGIVLFVYVKEKFFVEGAVKDVQVRHSSAYGSAHSAHSAHSV